MGSFGELPFRTLREILKYLPVCDLRSLEKVCLMLQLALPSFYHSFTAVQLEIFDARSHLKKRQVAFTGLGDLLLVVRGGGLTKIAFSDSGRTQTAKLGGVSAVVATPNGTVAVLGHANAVKISDSQGNFGFTDCMFEEEVPRAICAIGNFLLVATTRSEIFLVELSGPRRVTRVPRIPDACLEKGEVVDLAMIDILGERAVYALLSDGRLLKRVLASVVSRKHGNFDWETVSRASLEISADDFRVHSHDGRSVHSVCPENLEIAGPGNRRILGLRATGAGLVAAVIGNRLVLWRATRKLAELELDTPVRLLVDFAVRETADGVELALFFGEFVRIVELLWIDDELVEVENKSVLVKN